MIAISVRPMRKVFLCLFIVSQASCASRVPTSPSAMYPANPAVTHDAFYVSANGVARYAAPIGAPRWHRLGGIDTYQPVISGSMLVTGSAEGLFVLDTATGHLRWHLESDSPIFTPVVRGEDIYLGGHDGTVRKINLSSREPRWQRRFDGWIYTPALVGDRLIAGGQGRVLYGLDARTGQTRWRRDLPQELVDRPVAVSAQQAVIITLFNGEARLVDAYSGRTRWRLQDATVRFAPAVEPGVAYFGGYDGSVTAVSLENGEPLWQGRAGGRIRGMPSLSQSRVIVVTAENTFALFDKKTGRKRRECTLGFESVGVPIIRGGYLLIVNLHGGLRRIPLEECTIN